MKNEEIRASALWFALQRMKGASIHHIDGDPTNNNLANLMVVKAADNANRVNEKGSKRK